MSLYKFASLLVSISLVYGAPYGGGKYGIKTMVIFGDSYSDTGNVYKLTNQTSPPPYCYKGRSSNGPVWPEYLQKTTHWRVLNYAYGGATINNKVIQGHANKVPVPSIADQIVTHQSFLAREKLDPRTTLYVVAPAGNDYSQGVPIPSPQSVATNTYETSKVLLEPPFSGEHFVFFNAAFDHLPSNVQANATIGDRIKASRIKHNQLLNELLQENFKVDVKVFDMNALFEQELADPHYEDPQVGCVTIIPNNPPVICNHPKKKVFWDQVHPITSTHKMMAKRIGALFN
ncbi:hypothetical protein K7432_015267 [Basidiobolus ranarum]|uniref:Uncharacterized protein n=1 Tax=Basidiobolus ranarum TaxID=34480 RepID=A0ABR2WGE7_9FUNG